MQLSIVWYCATGGRALPLGCTCYATQDTREAVAEAICGGSLGSHTSRRTRFCFPRPTRPRGLHMHELQPDELHVAPLAYSSRGAHWSSHGPLSNGKTVIKGRWISSKYTWYLNVTYIYIESHESKYSSEWYDCNRRGYIILSLYDDHIARYNRSCDWIDRILWTIMDVVYDDGHTLNDSIRQSS